MKKTEKSSNDKKEQTINNELNKADESLKSLISNVNKLKSLLKSKSITKKKNE